MDWYASFNRASISHTDLVRLIVILSLTISCIVITAVSLRANIGTIYAQLFYFPILYATYFYPRRGLVLSGICAIVYEVLAYDYLFPDTGLLIYTTGQAVLFICIAAVVAHFTEKVNRSEARYRSIFETSLLGIVLFDQNSFAIRMTNHYLSQMLGYTQEEFVGMTFPQLFASKEEQRKFFEYLGSSEDVSNFETPFVTRNQDPLWVNLSWRRVGDNQVSCSVIDVNKRKLAEQAAEENFTRYQQVTEGSPTCIIITRDDKIVYTNPAFHLFSGYTADELAGKDLLPFIHPDDSTDFRAILADPGNIRAKTGKAEFRFLSKTGDMRSAAAFFTPLPQKGDTSLLINLVDITEKEQLKERIEQDDEHERKIISQMLELSQLDAGKIPLNYAVFSPDDLIRSLLNAGGYTAKSDITIDIPHHLTIEADPGKIATVIESMLSNAVNYSKPPRKIRISYQSNPSDTMHRIAIQDNGIGITNTQLDEIFEPFQQPDSGTVSRNYNRIGLSLSIAKKYVQIHGGYISVDSIVNLGSTFTIHLPKTRNVAKKT